MIMVGIIFSFYDYIIILTEAPPCVWVCVWGCV